MSVHVGNRTYGLVPCRPRVAMSRTELAIQDNGV